MYGLENMSLQRSRIKSLLKRFGNLLLKRFGNLAYFLIWHLLRVVISLFNFIKSGFGTSLLDSLVFESESRKVSVKHIATDGSDIRLEFFTPNLVCQWRAKTFSTKEPETLKWIDEFGSDGIFFDIGANIGLYSIYYAKSKSGKVLAFEPSVLNTKQLVKNISLNQVSDLVNVLTVPLTDKDGFATFKHSSLDEGGALSSFGVPYGHDGTGFQETLSYSLLGFTLDSLVELSLIPSNPSLIKIDVDGIEPLILRGARKTLNNPHCTSVLVEVTPKFIQQAAGVSQCLREAGFILRKSHADKNVNEHNQIWVRTN
jgi:FkbM family methyltransferase